MDKYLMVLFIIGVAIIAVTGVFCSYQMYKLVNVDASCRGLKHPKLWGVFSATGNNQSGLIMYLVFRRKYPIINITREQKIDLKKRKKRFSIGLVFLVIGAILCVWSIFLM